MEGEVNDATIRRLVDVLDKADYTPSTITINLDGRDYMKTSVVSMRKDRRGFKAEDGNWYSCYRAEWLDGIERGDVIEFTFREKGGYKNVESGSIKKVEGEAPTPASGGGSGGYKKRWHAYEDQDWQREINNRISKQNALNNAVTLVAANGDDDEDYTETLRRVLATAETFLSWSSDGVAVEESEDE